LGPCCCSVLGVLGACVSSPAVYTHAQLRRQGQNKQVFFYTAHPSQASSPLPSPPLSSFLFYSPLLFSLYSPLLSSPLLFSLLLPSPLISFGSPLPSPLFSSPPL